MVDVRRSLCARVNNCVKKMKMEKKVYCNPSCAIQQDKFLFRTTQQKVVPYRLLHGLSVELSYFSHRATSKKLLLYYTVLWFTDGVVVQRRFSLVPAPARQRENFVQSTGTRGTLSACGVNRYSDTGVCLLLKRVIIVGISIP